MLDLIIPMYDATKLDETLASIAYQVDTDIEIYLIDDCSSIDYSEILSFYDSILSIHYYKLSTNSGPAIARQKGIELSHSPYITFMDSDDSFGSPYAIKNMKDNIILKHHDFYIWNFVEESNNGNIYFHEGDQIWLHGKVYSRRFIENNKVHFNDTRSNEDNFFNQLMFLHKPNLYYSNEVVYVYRNNMSSFTRNNNYEKEFEGDIFYAYNISEALRECSLDCCDKKEISSLAYKAVLIMYFYVNHWKEKDLTLLIDYTKRIYRFIDFELLDDSFMEETMKSYLQYFIFRNYKLLYEKGSLNDFFKMLGEEND